LQDSQSSYASQEQRPAVSAPNFITIGSSKSDVVRIQGTPTEIKTWSWGDDWCFGYSKISFDTRDRVKEWINRGNLKVKL
jgi:hypothetical protein